MTSRPYIRVPYKAVQWVWISGHYDLHLDGLARHNGVLMRFETPQFYWCNRRRLSPVVRLWPLRRREKLTWLLRKKFFEVCVGHHWTYPQRARGYRRRKPLWLASLLFHFYYRATR